MKISVSSRIRNAMLGSFIALSLFFAGLIFLLVYVIEDQVFINQIKLEKLDYEQSSHPSDWKPKNSNISFYTTAEALPSTPSEQFKHTVIERQGIHEYFDDQHALFVAHFKHPVSNNAYFLVYDVANLLAVQQSRWQLLGIIGFLILVLAVLAVIIANRLTRSTLAPVRRLSQELKTNDIDDVVVELAQQFSEDEVGVLARELAFSLKRERESAQREYEFNRGVSHELRSPIQVAQATVELLEITSSKELHAPVQRLKRSINEMNETIEAFLWLASKRDLQLKEYCSVAELHTLVESIAKTRPQLDISVTSDVSSSHRYPLPQPVLSIMVRSLINNALVYSADGQVELHLSKGKLSISNPVEHNKQNSKGFGIGLAIVRRLCERFAGDLVTSTGEFSTYQVEVTLPHEKVQ